MIDLSTTFQNLTRDSDKWQAANEMAITPASFAVETHYDGRMFAVMTGEDKAETFGSFVINQCVREALWRILYDVQIYTENFVGYNISRRFHRQTIDLVNFAFSRPYKLDWPGIEKVNAAPRWIDHNLVVALDPFIMTEPVVTDLEVTGDMIVEVPVALAGNANDILIRKNDDKKGVFPLLKINGYPRRVGGNWLIQMDNHKSAYDPLLGVVVQSTRYAFVDVTQPVGIVGELKPVFSGTEEAIPYLRVEPLPNGDLRYWFFIYNLIDPAYGSDSAINLIAGEFYKLMPSITFKEYVEAATKATLTISTKSDCCLDCDNLTEVHRTFQISTRIADAARGIVNFSVDGQLIEDPLTLITTLDPSQACDFVNDPCLTYSLSVPYFTSPDKLPPRAQASVPNLHRAVMHRAAADAPLRDCLCELDYGFIHSCQEMYATVATTFSGTTIATNKYGNLHGHKVYEELMGNAYILKTLRLKGSADEKRTRTRAGFGQI